MPALRTARYHRGRKSPATEGEISGGGWESRGNKKGVSAFSSILWGSPACLPGPGKLQRVVGEQGGGGGGGRGEAEGLPSSSP